MIYLEVRKTEKNNLEIYGIYRISCSECNAVYIYWSTETVSETNVAIRFQDLKKSLK